MKKNKKIEWVDNNGNYVLPKKGYYISYNPSTSTSRRVETALVKINNSGNSFFILNGDFREEYEKLNTFSKCLKFFKSKPEFYSYWSVE